MIPIKISIITVSYNAEGTISETIDSVLSQKDDHVEYIIVDGGSKDGTLDIIKSYGSRIDNLISEPDNGISDAFNKGIRIATGDVICIINSDDILYDGAVNIAREKFSYDNEIDILYGDMKVFSYDVNDGFLVKADTDLEKLRYAFIMPHPGMFIARKAYEKYGMYSIDLKNAMDYELVSRMYGAGAKIVYSNSILAAYREGGTSQIVFDRTVKEHRLIAKRNGAGIFEREKYIFRMTLRHMVAPILKKMCIENYLHKIVKGY